MPATTSKPTTATERYERARDLDHAAVCRLWAAIMRQWMADAKRNRADRYYLAHFLDIDESQLHKVLRVNTRRFRRLER